MVVELRTFSSIEEFIKSIDNDISRLKALLGDYLRRMENVKIKAESLLKFEELLWKVAEGAPAGGKEVDLGSVKLVVNPSPKQILDTLVEVVRSIQDRITALEKARKSLAIFEQVKEVVADIEVVYKDGVPVTVIVRME